MDKNTKQNILSKKDKRNLGILSGLLTLTVLSSVMVSSYSYFLLSTLGFIWTLLPQSLGVFRFLVLLTVPVVLHLGIYQILLGTEVIYQSESMLRKQLSTILVHITFVATLCAIYFILSLNIVSIVFIVGIVTLLFALYTLKENQKGLDIDRTKPTFPKNKLRKFVSWTPVLYTIILTYFALSTSISLFSYSFGGSTDLSNKELFDVGAPVPTGLSLTKESKVNVNLNGRDNVYVAPYKEVEVGTVVEVKDTKLFGYPTLMVQWQNGIGSIDLNDRNLKELAQKEVKYKKGDSVALYISDLSETRSDDIVVHATSKAVSYPKLKVSDRAIENKDTTIDDLFGKRVVIEREPTVIINKGDSETKADTFSKLNFDYNVNVPKHNVRQVLKIIICTVLVVIYLLGAIFCGIAYAIEED